MNSTDESIKTLENHPRWGWRKDDRYWNCGAVGNGEADDGGDKDLSLDWALWTQTHHTTRFILLSPA
jgi:hypothetical protein